MNRIPITIVTGYLGSGKTTYINNLIKNSSTKIGILVNEFGEIDIDGKIFEANTTEVISFSNTCMCCAIRGDIVSSILNLIDKFHPEAIIIETSGLAHPLPIALSLQEDGIKELCYLDCIMCVVDCLNVLKVANDDYIVNEQLESSDYALLSKSSLVSKMQIANIKDYLLSINKNFVIVDIDKSSETENKLLNLGLTHDFKDTDAQHLHMQIETMSFTFDSIKDIDSVCNLLLQDIILYRVKGFIKSTDKTYILHIVNGRLTLNEINKHLEHSELIIIGKNLDKYKNFNWTNL